MALKLRRKRRLGFVAVMIAVMGLAACDTQPATNVSYQSATLNAKGACTGGTSGQWWFQVRDVSRGGGWYDATGRNGYSCSQNTGEVNFQPQGVGGLNPGTLYYFRLAVTVNGEFMWFDRDGAKNGGSYDSFRTRDIGGRADQDAPPGDVSAPCTSDSPTDACAASNRIRTKPHPLRNRLLWVFCEGCPFVEGNISDHRSYINWVWNLDTKNIRSISYRDDEVNCLANFGTCKPVKTVWRLETCDRSGNDTCLFRSEGWVEFTFTFRGVPGNRQLVSCLGTRINWDGSHTRNAWEGECGTGAAKASRHVADVSDQELSIGGVPVGRYLARGEMEAFDLACISKTADKRECKQAERKLYDGLPGTVQRQIRQGRASHVPVCPALSPEARDERSPGSRCARRS
jgi:hypothetical protein